MKIIKIIFLLCIVILTNSCKVECPCFNKNLLTWMPYEVDDELLYVNQQNDTLFFTVKSKILSEEYKEKKRFEEECFSKAEFEISDDLSTSGYDYTIYNYKDGATIDFKFSILIHNNVYSSGGNSFLDIDCCLDTMTINNKLYQETITIERDTINFSDEIWKVIVANNYGIVKFYDKKTGYEWTLVEE